MRAGSSADTGRPAESVPVPSPGGSFRIRGGIGAPARARHHLLEHLDTGVSGQRASDAATVVSELVTNSVLHANVGADRSLLLELTTAGDSLRIGVTDPGSALKPHIMPADPARPSGHGLRVVDAMCSAWGVVHDATGTTLVWCDLRLADALPIA